MDHNFWYLALGREILRNSRRDSLEIVKRLALAVLLVAAVFPSWASSQPQVPTDVQGHWAEDRILLLMQRKIIDPLPNGTFRPFESITRGEFVKWLVVATGLPLRQGRTSSFADVPLAHPLSQYLETALAYGMIPRTPRFLPSFGITRGDAIALTVHVLGYSFETLSMSGRTLPYDDVGTLPESVRGAVAVATFAEPPLLREPSSTHVRPFSLLTRGEAASLVWAQLMATERGITLRTTTTVASGVELATEKRGALRIFPIWRIQIGSFANEDNAQRLAAITQARGFTVFVDALDNFYKVRIGNFATAEEAELVKEDLAADGFPAFIFPTVPEFEALAGPFRAAMLLIDPKAGVKLVPAFGDGRTMRRQRTSEIARRVGALAAVNGGFFVRAGEPIGCLVVSGEILSAPDPQRTCAGISDDGTIMFDLVRFDAVVTTPAGTMRIDGVNRERRADELVLYRPAFDATTRTNEFGAEAIVSGGVVTSVVDGKGNAPIPRDGFVLSGHGRARQWIVQMVQPGASPAMNVRLLPQSGDSRWTRVVHAIGGGPRLLAAGKYVGGEGFSPGLSDRRHPRTAMGVLGDGRVILFVVDGRQPYHSLGMTLPELAEALRQLGVVDAMNLDGGGSTTMVVAGRLINFPSDETGERLVPDALLVLPAGQSSR